MAQTTAQKLKIKENASLLALNAPNDFKDLLEPLPAGVRFTKKPGEQTQVHWFVQNRSQMENELKEVLPLIKNEVVCWIYYPKGTSKIQTDLTRDKGWEKLLEKDMQWLSLVSFNDTWSAFGMRQKFGADLKKEMKPQADRPILNFIDPVAKTVTIPNDLATAFKSNKNAEAKFNALAYSHRKEYVEWIVTAKKEETRAKRVAGTIEMLEKGKKNPNEK